MKKMLQKNLMVAKAISIDGLEVEEVKSFIYLGEAGGSHKNVTCRAVDGKKVICHSQSSQTSQSSVLSKLYSKHRKLRILKSCMTSFLPYGAEMSRIASADIERLDVFHTITNLDLSEITRQSHLLETINVR